MGWIGLGGVGLDSKVGLDWIRWVCIGLGGLEWDRWGLDWIRWGWIGLGGVGGGFALD